MTSRRRTLKTSTPLSESYAALSQAPWVGAPSEEKIAETFEAVLESKEDAVSAGEPTIFEVLPFLVEGAQAIVDDDFSKCFRSRPPPSWNWNVYLMPAWCLGVFIRYCVLFPLRLLWLIVSLSCAACAFATASLWLRGATRARWLRKVVSFVAAAFVASWSGVVRFHGTKPKRRANQLFVANHTTMLDVCVLLQWFTYSLVGQSHSGFVGLVQSTLLAPLECIWFQRGASSDREQASQMIREHIADETKNPLLIFPEGTCTCNEYAVQFKKGAFSLGEHVVVHPIAIKYDRSYCDMFHNSKEESFFWHLFRLMTSWAMVADVYYLEPQRIREGESPEDFAQRVKTKICNAASLKDSKFDGYMKYWQPSARYKELRQKAAAHSMRFRRLLAKEEINTKEQHTRKRSKPQGTHAERRSSSFTSQTGGGDLSRSMPY